MTGTQADPGSPPWLVAILDDLDPDGTTRVGRHGGGATALPLPSVPVGDGDPVKRARAYLAKMPPGIQGSNGSGATYAAACAMWNGFGLDVEVAYGLLAAEYNPRCEPPWSERELRHKVEDAASKPHREPRGYLLARGDLTPYLPPAWSPSPTAPALPPPAVGQPSAGPPPVPPPPPGEYVNEADDDPHRIARGFLAGYTHRGRPTLAYWRQQFHAWDGTRWVPVEDIDPAVTQSADRHFLALYRPRKALFDQGKLDKEPEKGKTTRRVVADTIGALRGTTNLAGVEDQPAWLWGEAGPPADELVAAKNGLAHLPAVAAGSPQCVVAPTPAFFNANAVGYDVRTDAPAPALWLRFLADLWADDPESVALLQEWFGHLLTTDNRHHKMMLLIGPPRSGKGTIMRVLQALIGADNCCGLTLSELAQPFGMENMLGRSVAVIEDARLSGRSDAAVIAERLLTISGNGTLTVNRKYLRAVKTKLSARFVIATNEVPRLSDASGALASRWSVLRFVLSFAGREDTTLPDRLLSELPGIFLWAVEGWKRLRDRGRFTEPSSAAGMRELIEETGSAIRTFVKERCQVDQRHSVTADDLYAEWVKWCEEVGRKDAGTVNNFGRELRAAVPQIERCRPRSAEGRKYVYRGIRLAPYNWGDGGDLGPNGPDAVPTESGRWDQPNSLLDQILAASGPNGPNETQKPSRIGNDGPGEQEQEDRFRWDRWDHRDRDAGEGVEL